MTFPPGTRSVPPAPSTFSTASMPSGWQVLQCIGCAGEDFLMQLLGIYLWGPKILMELLYFFLNSPIGGAVGKVLMQLVGIYLWYPKILVKLLYFYVLCPIATITQALRQSKILYNLVLFYGVCVAIIAPECSKVKVVNLLLLNCKVFRQAFCCEVPVRKPRR